MSLRPPAPARRLFLSMVPGLLASALLSGCSQSPPTGPAPADRSALGGASAVAMAGSGFGSATFYPLAIGDSWTYEGGGLAWLSSGPGDPGWVDYKYAFVETHRLIGTTHHEGTAYVVEEQTHREIPPSQYGPWTWWDRLREDPSGLFSLDTLLQEPPTLDGGVRLAAAAPSPREHPLRVDFSSRKTGGPGDASVDRFADRVERVRELVRGIIDRRGQPPAPSGLEVQFLAYPLHPGQTWSNRPDIPWPSRVDRVETIETPAGRFEAYRIDIDPGGTPLAAGEWIRVWYSRAGYLGYSTRLISEGTDINGEPTGATSVFDDSMFVSSVDVSH